MSTEVRPLGVVCDLQCKYCYQNVHREAGNFGGRYDLEAMKRAIEERGVAFHLFGGEPLLMAEEDLEELWKLGYERFGTNGLQTNGVRLNDRHVALIRAYRVRVGISIDGPGPLNDARWAGTLEKTRAATARSEAAIRTLCEAGMPPAVLIQLTRSNCHGERLAELTAWMRELDAMGVSAARLHILEIESREVRSELGMSIDENLAVLSTLMKLEKTLPRLRFDVAREMREMLLGRDEAAACVWRACDPYTTEAVYGVDGDGTRHNCGLTDKEGINFQRPDRPGYERYLALYHTPQEYGGCQGCRFFLVCKGQCPGTAIDKDWRNRSEYCEVWKHLFEQLEAELVEEGRVPLSLSPHREHWEREMVEGWQHGHNLMFEVDMRMSKGPRP